jgi:hypothetical protein
MVIAQITVFSDVTSCNLVEEPAASIFRVELQNSEAAGSSETLVNIYQTTRRYMPFK